MKLSFSSRKWHAWISFVLSLPILVVAVTSILIAHSQALGFRDIKIDPSWVPDYLAAPIRREENAASSGGNMRLPAESAPKAYTVARLIRDVHTGEAFFGRDLKWIWDDIVGGAMTFLAGTGIYLWWNGQRKMFVAKRERAKSIVAH